MKAVRTTLVAVALAAGAAGVTSSGAEAQATTPKAKAQGEFRREPLQERVDVRELADSLQLVLQQQQSIARSLITARAAYRRDPSDSIGREISRLSDKMKDVTWRLMKAANTFSATCDRAEQPEGWMGVAFTGRYRVSQKSNGPLVFRFFDYPIVDAVDPGSPAERAGMEIGDTIITLADDDIRGNDVVFKTLLRPGSVLPVKIRREGGPRTLRLNIERRPRSMQSGCGAMQNAVAEALRSPAVEAATSNFVFVGGAEAPRPPRMPPGTVTVRVEAPEAAAADPVVALAPAGIGYVFKTSSTFMYGGAEFITMDAKILKTLGAKSGAFVSAVAPRSPASMSGLQQGDVVTRAGDLEVVSPIGLQRVVVDARERGDREVVLKVVREKRAQTVVLKL